jgi:CBS domain-containing protein
VLKQDPQVLAAGGVAALDLSNLTLAGFLVRNLLPVTLGNIIGGSLLVGAVYWFVYLRRTAAEPVRRLMTAGPPSVPAGTTVAEAVAIMQKGAAGSVLVGPPGEAVGIASEADIVRKVVATGRAPADVRVEEIMSAPLITMDIGTPIYQIYRQMADRRVRHLVIIEGGRQVGFVSVKDLLKGPS